MKEGRRERLITGLNVSVKLLQLNDCIRNKTVVCNPRQNSVRDKFSQRQNSVGKKILGYFLGPNFFSDCILSQIEFVLDFQRAFLSYLRKNDAYHH